MKIVIDNAIPYIAGLLEPYAEVVYAAGDHITAETVHDADALIIRTRTRCTASLLAGSRVQLIASATIGFDHIDRHYCEEHDIEVCTAAGCNARGVLQWVGAALEKLEREQALRPSLTTLGIIGVGHVGSLVAQYATAWGYRVVCCDPPRQKAEHLTEFVTAEEVARTADIITLHTPLDATTRHLVDADFLAATRPQTVLVNASRGEVVDTAALLHSGRQFLLDVWEHEPNLDPTALARATVATTHIAGYTAQGKANATSLSVAHVARHFGLQALQDWYPTTVTPTVPRPISWEEMCRTVRTYCDLDAETACLRQNPERFEQIRNTYALRQEYF